MRKLLFAPCILILFASFHADAALRQQEDWYFQFGLGIPVSTTMPDVVQDTIDAHDSSIDFAADFAGAYFPIMQNKGIVGFNISGNMTSAESTGISTTVYTYLYGLSGMYWFNTEIGGAGPFARFDIGYSMLDVKMEIDIFGTVITSEGSGTGTGIMLGVGYSLPSAAATANWMFSLNFVSKDISSVDGLASGAEGTYSAINLMLGGLW